MTSCWFDVRILEHRLQRFVVGRAEEPMNAEQATKRPQRERLVGPEGCIPGDKPGRLALGSIDEHPVVAVGDEPDPNIGGVKQFHHQGGRRGLPVPARDRLFQVLRGRINLNQQPGLPGIWHAFRVFHDDIRPESLAVLGDRCPERLRNRLSFGEYLIRQAERLLEHEVDPLAMDRRGGPLALLVVFPLLKGKLHEPRVVRIVSVEAVREHSLEHRDREERSGDVDQGEPFGVVVGGGHVELPSGPCWPKIKSNLLVLLAEHRDEICRWRFDTSRAHQQRRR